MHTQNKKSLLTLILLIFTLSTHASVDEDLKQLGSDFNLNVDGQLTSITQFFQNNSSIATNDLQESSISLSVSWKEQIRAVISANIAQLMANNQIAFNEDFDIESFISEAYIEIREFNNIPVAIIIGKRPIILGQDIQKMPAYTNNPLMPMQELSEVFGLTVELTRDPLGIIDHAEFSVYELISGDLEIGKLHGKSLRISKYLSDQLLLTIGASSEGQNFSDSTKRLNVGLVGINEKGTLIGWFEGVIFSNDPNYPNSSLAITVGTSYEFLPSNYIIAEFNFINKSVMQFGIGLKTVIKERFEIGVDARVQHLLEENLTDFFIGINLTYRFDFSTNSPEDIEEELLFNNEDE